MASEHVADAAQRFHSEPKTTKVDVERPQVQAQAVLAAALEGHRQGTAQRDLLPLHSSHDAGHAELGQHLRDPHRRRHRFDAAFRNRRRRGRSVVRDHTCPYRPASPLRAEGPADAVLDDPHRPRLGVEGPPRRPVPRVVRSAGVELGREARLRLVELEAARCTRQGSSRHEGGREVHDVGHLLVDPVAVRLVLRLGAVVVQELSLLAPRRQSALELHHGLVDAVAS